MNISWLKIEGEKLTLDEQSIQNLNFRDHAIELLVLSAGESAIGNETSELGFVGFAHRMGVKSVLAS